MNYETDRDNPTKSDGIYTPGTHREIYQKISTDYQEIVALTNLINVGRPLPLAEIMLLYEVGMHTRIGRALRGFARDPSRSEEFPDSAAFHESDTFLDSPISNAVRLRGEADGDFDLRNQYKTRSYESFFDHPDGLWQQSVPLPDGDLLSPHNPDPSILLIPGFALGGLVGAQVQFLLLAAAAMALAFVLQTASLDGGWSVGSSRWASIPATSCPPSNNRDATRAPMTPAHPVSRILNRAQSSPVLC